MNSYNAGQSPAGLEEVDAARRAGVSWGCLAVKTAQIGYSQCH